MGIETDDVTSLDPANDSSTGQTDEGRAETQHDCLRPTANMFEGTSHTGTSVTVQTNVVSRHIYSKFGKLKSSIQNCRRNTATVERLKRQKNALKRKLDRYEEMYNLNKIENDMAEGSERAAFLIDQLRNYSKKSPRWSETTIRHSILWSSRSPSSYALQLSSNALKLPTRPTLKKYIGPTTADSVTELMVTRLKSEAEGLKDEEKLGSLLMDEMAIKECILYDRAGDQLTGFANYNASKSAGLEGEVANRLLCFLFLGLSTRYRLPVGFYFTKGLQSPQLRTLILEIMKRVEEAGFIVVRLVADNHKTNVNAFSLLCGGEDKPSIQHPFDPQRKLFIAYDHCHIVKNIRSQFLSDDKNFQVERQNVSSKFLKDLADIQETSGDIITPVRCLTRKHLFPNNLEKMNVKRAVHIFSPEVVAALEWLQQYGQQYGIGCFKDAAATVKFMKMIGEWFQILNIKNPTHSIHSNSTASAAFFNVGDERLRWLEEDFLSYIETWRASCTHPRRQFLTNETYRALKLTTLSTVGCVKYLLKAGFHLTRKFSSDEIEILFSAMRRMAGSNDQTSAASVLSSLQRILVTGLVKPSQNANVVTSENSAMCTPSLRPLPKP
ncbi:uncharacterized protein LOC135398009 [Ornithodoros turicata]|uniref:uncharacterized protein LOC135398009 n=1 Tax=Ornithodoros turicata TaxID=34597 RepID=UPI003139A7AE